MDRLEHALFATLLYFFSLLIFGAAWWKAAVIGLAVLGACVLNFGARWIARGALLFFIYASAVWVDLLPVREWNAAVGRQLASGPVKPCGLQAALFGSDARRAQGESQEGLGEL
jgi:hypothetical protein